MAQVSIHPVPQPFRCSGKPGCVYVCVCVEHVHLLRVDGMCDYVCVPCVGMCRHMCTAPCMYTPYRHVACE